MRGWVHVREPFRLKECSETCLEVDIEISLELMLVLLCRLTWTRKPLDWSSEKARPTMGLAFYRVHLLHLRWLGQLGSDLPGLPQRRR